MSSEWIRLLYKLIAKRCKFSSRLNKTSAEFPSNVERQIVQKQNKACFCGLTLVCYTSIKCYNSRRSKYNRKYIANMTKIYDINIHTWIDKSKETDFTFECILYRFQVSWDKKWHAFTYLFGKLEWLMTVSYPNCPWMWQNFTMQICSWLIILFARSGC